MSAPAPIRVAHVGTGTTGREALRGILTHPGLELVGLWAASPDKIGRDAGELVGRDTVGITAVPTLDEVLDAGPQVLCYCGNGLGREADAASEMAAALERGVNVATISLLNMLYPPSGPDALREPLAAAAKAGNATFLATGLDPGFSTDLLPLTLLNLSESVQHILIQEIGVYDHYDVEPVIRGIMGFGQPPSYGAPIATGGAFEAFWGPMVRQLADRLGVELDEVVGTSDYAVHDRELVTSVGSMAAGTVVARRVACDGVVDGRAVITAEHITRMSSEVAPDWPTFEGIGESNYRIVIDGNPSLRCDLDLGKAQGVWGSVSGTAMRLVNLIPAVVGAPPGLTTALDLPLIPSRSVVSTGRADRG